MVNGQLFFYYISTCIYIQCISLKLKRILSTIQGLLCSANLVGSSICGANQLLVSTSKNSYTSFFLPKFSRLMFKSPVNITFLFSLQSAFRVYFKYHKNSVSFCFGCLYTTPTTKFSLLVCMISIQCALYSLWELEHFLVSLTTDHLLHYNKVLQQIIYCFWYKIHNHLLTLSLVYPHSFGSQLSSVPTRW